MITWNKTPIQALTSFKDFARNATLYVPQGSIDAYKEAYDWKDFKEIKEIKENISISSNGIATYNSTHDLDFSEVENVRAYIVSAFQPKKGEVALTRVYEVPAGMGLVLIGKEGEYEIPLGTGKAMVSNLLVGINETTTLKATEDDRTNFILPENQEEAAFRAVTNEVELSFGKAYLPLPTESVALLEDGKLTLHFADPSLGDVDGDGYVNISDVTTLVNIILGK
ncbi:MAG: hypothetical protein IJR02_11185 [Bacteroidaceae bacterium]|nr:hypothetical protein [Bacteroidaceae bacterium]